jgi:hypothetical protein
VISQAGNISIAIDEAVTVRTTERERSSGLKTKFLKKVTIAFSKTGGKLAQHPRYGWTRETTARRVSFTSSREVQSIVGS